VIWKHALRDPLLIGARLVVGGFFGILIVGVVLVAAGLLAVLTLQRADLIADMASKGLGMPGYLMVVLATAMVLCLLSLAMLFALALLRLIDSVGLGDPFVPINADRLRTMGWLTVGIQCVLFMLAAIGIWFGDMKSALVAEDAINLGIGAIVLTLVLFILARVFRLGTKMRDELEGTV
jgi:hypothetical protein